MPEFKNGFRLDDRLQETVNIIVWNGYRSILDVGCRTGFLLFHLIARQLIDRGVGLDINPSAIRLCQEYALKAEIEKKLVFSECMFEDYTDTQKYDCIVMTDILEHCISPEVFLNKAHLFSDRLLMSFPIDNPESVEYKKSGETYQEHVRLLTKDKVRELLSKTHWKILNLYNVLSYFSTDIYLLETGEESIVDSKKPVITSAEYGTDGTFVDVLDILRSQQSSTGIILHIDNYSMRSDPAKGLAKVLKISYTLDDALFKFEIQEGDDLVIRGSRG